CKSSWRIKNKRGKRLRNDKARSRTRVNIGSAFQRWRELKERKGLRSDAVAALFLLDRRVTNIGYQKSLTLPLKYVLFWCTLSL
uniref:Uncharacterized protein n=1 Tax=Sinocyclocheilus anshuiensis TaxID=1608454 RepID=A0A671RUI6_9TELE